MQINVVVHYIMQMSMTVNDGSGVAQIEKKLSRNTAIKISCIVQYLRVQYCGKALSFLKHQ